MAIIEYLVLSYLIFAVFPFLVLSNWDYFVASRRIAAKRQERISDLKDKIVDELEKQKRNSIGWVTVRDLKKKTSKFDQTEEWNEAKKFIKENFDLYNFNTMKIDNYDHEVVLMKEVKIPKGESQKIDWISLFILL